MMGVTFLIEMIAVINKGTRFRNHGKTAITGVGWLFQLEIGRNRAHITQLT